MFLFYNTYTFLSLFFSFKKTLNQDEEILTLTTKSDRQNAITTTNINAPKKNFSNIVIALFTGLFTMLYGRGRRRRCFYRCVCSMK